MPLSKLFVAPMVGYTRPPLLNLCRWLVPGVQIMSEMLHINALRHQEKLLLSGYKNLAPVCLQIGCSNQEQAESAQGLAGKNGFSEINLNLGCPSSRVQSGCFGAVLMKNPPVVRDILKTLVESGEIPVSAKIRPGVDEAWPLARLEDFFAMLFETGIEKLFIHARIALLKGLSPAQNRSIPPLEYDKVFALASTFGQDKIILNGGIQNPEDAPKLLKKFGGIMLGRAVLNNPLILVDFADQLGLQSHRLSPPQIMEKFIAAYPLWKQQGNASLPLVCALFLPALKGFRGARGWREQFHLAAHKGLDELAELQQEFSQAWDALQTEVSV